MTDYKPGDRVRVSFEAEVFGLNGAHPQFIDMSGEIVELDASWDEFTVEKLTPDYKAQIEALEPGTAFVLTTGPIENTYLRIGPGLATKYGVISTVEYILELHGAVTDLRILK